MNQSPIGWQRGPRSTFNLTYDAGVYALFLREGSTLPGVEAGEQGLLYNGLAANRRGLKERCHFDARTRNHSPRKSLAVLLMDTLMLVPVLITKPNSANTWGLDGASDARLSLWMHNNLDLAIEVCADCDARETELVARYAPPLNLTKCTQTAKHRLVSDGRAGIMAGLQGPQARVAEAVRHPAEARAILPSASVSAAREPSQTPPSSARRFVGADVDTAEAIAARYGLNPKSYRQRLRDSISWYRKPQDWTFPVDSSEHCDMIAVAERMTGR